MTGSPRDWLDVPPVQDATGPVQIDLTVTLDDEIGAVPPIDDGLWHVVHSAGGHTTWRRIHLEP